MMPLSLFFNLFTRDGLIRLKLLALRRRVWFKALSRVERSIVELTIQVVDKVRSIGLAQVLTTIAQKLEGWLGSKKSFKEEALEAGRLIAERIVRAASKIGLRNTQAWVEDEHYVFYLGVSYLNSSRIYKL